MRDSTIQRLRHQPDSIAILLSSLDEGGIRSRPIRDKWSIFQNLAHLGRYQEVFISRIEKMLEGQNPSFSRYVAEEDGDFETWCNKSLSEMKNQLKSIRQQLNERLNSLTDEQLKLTGVHPLFGTMTIERWTEFFLLHEAHHFYTIFRLVPLVKSDAAQTH